MRVRTPPVSGMTTKSTTDRISVSQGIGYADDPQQEGNDRREGDQDDQVVGGDLDDRVGGIALGQVAPDKHHRRAGRGTQQDRAGQVVPWPVSAGIRLLKRQRRKTRRCQTS